MQRYRYAHDHQLYVQRCWQVKVKLSARGVPRCALGIHTTGWQLQVVPTLLDGCEVLLLLITLPAKNELCNMTHDA